MVALVEKLGHLPRKLSTPAGLSLVLLVLLLFIYIPLTCYDFYWDDSVEFVLVAHSWGIAHPSGYPLYTIACNLFSYLSWPLAWSLSILSAVFLAVAMVMLMRVMLRLGTSSVYAFTCAIVVGQGAVFVEQASIQEVYTLHLLLQFAVIERFLAWRQTASRFNLYQAFFLFGLSFSHHMTSIWLVIPLLILLWPELKELWSQKKTFLKACGIFAVGLTPYLYLPIRSFAGPLWDQGSPQSLNAFWNLVTGDIFRYRLFSLNAHEIWLQVQDWFDSALEQWGSLLLIFSLLGMIRMFQHNRRAFFAGLSWFAIALLYCFNYFIPDKDGYYLIPHALMGISAVAGAAFIVYFCKSRVREGFGKVVMSGLLIIPLVGLFLLEDFSQKDNTSLRDITYEVWSDITPGSIMVTEDLNLHYASVLMQDQGQLAYDRIVVSTYLAGFDWYLDFLKKRWPDVVWPEDLKTAVSRMENKIKQVKGRDIGVLRQHLVNEVIVRIVRANIHERSVYLFAHEEGEERRRHLGFSLQNHGLVYKLVDAEQVEPFEFKCDYAPKYLKGKSNLKDSRERHVAAKFATACNRLGIQYAMDNKPYRALKAIDKALRYDSKYLPAMKNRGSILVQQIGNLDAGERAWRRYLLEAKSREIAPDNSVVKWLERNR